LTKIGTLDTLVVLSEDLAKFDGQFEGYTNKIIDVLRTAFKGDESKVDNACRIADRTVSRCEANVEPPGSYLMNYQCMADTGWK
jgi:hypothetical protein